MSLIRVYRPLLWLVILALPGLLLAACGGPEPIAVYVTPTLPPTDAPPAQVAEHVVLVHRPAGPALIPPALEWLLQTPSPTPGSYGPIIQPGSVTAAPTQGAPAAPLATNTPPPTLTPPPTATPRAVTPTTTPTATPTGAAGTPTITFTPTLEGTPLPTLNADLMGIQMHADLSEQEFDLALWYLKKTGVTWIKFQFAWEIVEPQQGVLSDVFYRYRLFIQRAKQEGFNVLISVAKAPDWARSTVGEDGPARDPQLLADFLSRMLGEIRADLYGRSYVDAIEVWNEPNLRREWNGGALTGTEYMRYFDAAYHAIRAAEGGPGIVIVTAGLAPTGISDNVVATDDRLYLRQMYQAGLAGSGYQNVAIGVHPYGAWNPPDARWCGQETCSGRGWDVHPTFFFLDNIEDYRAIMEANGDGARQLWATEFGWPTYDGLIINEGTPAPPPPGEDYFTFITAWDQANYIMRAFEIAQDLPYLGPMFLWNLNFASTQNVERQDPRAGYAILGNMADPRRPAFILLEHAPKTSAEDDAQP
jgi:hypothetical protein